jgi:7,8-dihydropterin-6-yl-methyl-4-(beta-D-ribofuranosyl)aminobenzene 5'-phosphate synthase
MQQPVALQPVDSAEITILIDNSIDVSLPSSELVWRHPLAYDRPQLLAEYGFALLVTLSRQGQTVSLLYDAGVGTNTLLHNMAVLGIAPGTVRAIVLSHGHIDHYGGLAALLPQLEPPPLPLVLHPDAWRDRKVVFQNGYELPMPPPQRSAFTHPHVTLHETRAPSLWLDDTVLVTGQVARTTAFEQGMPGHMARTAAGDEAGAAWEDDTSIWDDQAVVLHVQGKGLVILSGCSHAGIINMVRYAQQLTGIAPIHAIVGGLSLSGMVFAPVIAPTVEALAAIAPDIIVPGHSTGTQAIQEIAHALPDAYVPTCVGTRLRLVGDVGNTL